MERLQDMLTFAEVVRAGSFVGAAEQLQVAPSVVSKHISRLEKGLGVKLLHRTTRSLSLTEAGSAFHPYCARVREEIAQSEQALDRLQAEPQGHLRVTTMPSVSTALLAPMIPGFLRRYPKIELEISASDHVVNLIEEGFDLALRITSKPPDNLVARKLLPISFGIYGSPGYLDRHGLPRSIEDLQAHCCFNYPMARAGFWTLWHGGQPLEVPVHARLVINSVDVVRKLTVAGGGLGLLPNYAIARQLHVGALTRVLPELHGLAEADLYGVYLPNRYGSPKLRAFLEHFAEHLNAQGLPAGEVGRKRADRLRDVSAQGLPAGEVDPQTRPGSAAAVRPPQARGRSQA